MTHKHFEAGFELKFLAETGVFEGYASVFNVVDQVNDKIAPGAFRESLAVCHKAGRLPPLLWQHEALEPIGAWREMYEDNHGLYIKGDLFINDIPLAKEAYKLLKENVVTGLSIGYRAQESHFEQKSGVRVLTKLDLLEVSLVTFPANDQARVIGVKRLFSAGAVPSAREFEAFLRDAGLSRRLAKGVIAQGYKALLAPASTPAPAPERDADEDLFISLFTKRLQEATLEIKTDMILSRCTRSLKQATADTLAGRCLRKDDGVFSVGEGDDDLSGNNNLDSGEADPTWSPLDFVGGLAGGIEDALGGLTAEEAGSLADVVGARAGGSTMADALDSSLADDITDDSAARISAAAQSVEDFLGGVPTEDNWGINKNGDLWALNGDNKIHFDINEPGNGPGGVPDDPHFHLETIDDNGDWVDAGGQHRYYFNDIEDDGE